MTPHPLYGPAIPLKSAIFKNGVRFPGSSVQGHYIPSEDYPLTFYPTAQIVEARLKDGAMCLPNFTRTMLYHVGEVRDMQPDDSRMPPVTNITEKGGVLVSPTPRMRQTEGGAFERVVDEASHPFPMSAEVEAAQAKAIVAELEAPKAKGWPKGKPRKKAAAPAPEPPKSPAVLVQHPGARVQNGPQGGA